MAMLLGLFQVSILHNVVHLLFGVAGLVLARTARGAQTYLVWGGVINAVLRIYALGVLLGRSLPARQTAAASTD
jgi:hypothetical protein